MFRKFLGGLTGIVAAFSVIALVQSIGHLLYPTPEGLDMKDPAAFAAYVKSLPPGAFIPVLLSYFAGTAAGTFVASWIGGGNGRVYAAIFGTLVLALTIANLFMIPHPHWFSVLAILGIPASAYAGGRLAPKRKYG